MATVSFFVGIGRRFHCCRWAQGQILQSRTCADSAPDFT
jgi:hypothetical protein